MPAQAGSRPLFAQLLTADCSSVQYRTIVARGLLSSRPPQAALQVPFPLPPPQELIHAPVHQGSLPSSPPDSSAGAQPCLQQEPKDPSADPAAATLDAQCKVQHACSTVNPLGQPAGYGQLRILLHQTCTHSASCRMRAASGFTGPVQAWRWGSLWATASRPAATQAHSRRRRTHRQRDRACIQASGLRPGGHSSLCSGWRAAALFKTFLSSVWLSDALGWSILHVDQCLVQYCWEQPVV